MSNEMDKQTGSSNAVLNVFLTPVVVQYMFIPSFAYGNVLTGEAWLSVGIDELHSRMSSHPWDTCGPWFSAMLACGARRKDTPAAERTWAEQKPTNGYMAVIRSGMKLFFQYFTDHSRCYRKVYDSGTYVGQTSVLWDLIGQAARVPNVDVAYDSLGRMVLACTVCGARYSHKRCQHQGAEPVDSFDADTADNDA